MVPAGQIFANYWRKHANANSAIVVSGLALIGIVWAVTIERVSFERGHTIAETAKQNSNLAIAFEEHTIRTIKGIDQAVLFVRNQYDEYGLKLNIGRMIESGALDASLFRFIGITDERGNVVLGSHEFKSTNVADRESFKVHQQNNDNEMFIGKPNLGRITGKWAIPMSHRINKTDGSFGGIVYASVDPEYFTGFYQKADLGEHGAISLTGLDGISRATRIGRKGTLGEDMRGTRIFEERAKNSIGSFLGGGRLDSVVRFLSFRTLAKYPLIVTVGTSEAETLASFHERERRYYLTAGFASTMIVIFAAFIMVALSRRKRAEETARASENRLRLALSNINMAVFHQDRSLRYTWMYQPQMSYLPEQVIGHTDAELLPPEAARRVTELKQRVIEKGETVRDEVRVAVKGETFFYDLTAEPLREASGAIIGLAGVTLDITERTRAREVLEQSLHRVQALSERVMKVQQEERDGIARELHDELGQTLTALKVNLQMLEPYCAGGVAEDYLTEALVIAGRSLEQVRGMMLDLRPQGLEDLGLAAVLESHLAKQAEAAGWDAQFETTLPGRPRPELEMACFRVAQEALTNVMRHAHAKQVRVALGLNEGEVQLSVRDDGESFDVAVATDASRAGGFGLIGMQERVRQMGGRLAIHSAPGRGTEVRASFPCEPAGGREADANANAQTCA